MAPHDESIRNVLACRRRFDPAVSNDSDRFGQCARLGLAAVVGGLALMILSLAALAAAQGGKAEPLRIHFRSGSTITTLTGVLSGDAQREYVLAARKDQHLRIKLTFTPIGSLTVAAKQPAGTDLSLSVDSRSEWSARLPDDGEYEIRVTRANKTQPRSHYTLTVRLQ
jgi:hypothetical protein